MIRFCRKLFTVQLLGLVLTTCVLTPVARTAVIDTRTVLSDQSRSTQAELQYILAREDVRKQLVTYGVDPDAAALRVAALTDAELSQLRQHMSDLPAGSSALAVLGAVFLVLLVLELVGVTNIFSKL